MSMGKHSDYDEEAIYKKKNEQLQKDNLKYIKKQVKTPKQRAFEEWEQNHESDLVECFEEYLRDRLFRFGDWQIVKTTQSYKQFAEEQYYDYIQEQIGDIAP